jgi:hypothetical protein
MAVARMILVVLVDGAHGIACVRAQLVLTALPRRIVGSYFARCNLSEARSGPISESPMIHSAIRCPRPSQRADAIRMSLFIAVRRAS